MNPLPSLLETEEPNDLARFNRLLAYTRLRAAFAFTALIILLQALGIDRIRPLPVLALCAAAAMFSAILIRHDAGRLYPWPIFYLQCAFDLLVITAGVGSVLDSSTSLLLRGVFIILIVPPSLVSVRVGFLVTVFAALAHELLLGLERGFSWEVLTSLESTVPIFLFFLVAQQCFFYANHLSEKNQKLARLAKRLTHSQRRLAGLVRVAQTLNATLDADDLLSRLNAAALEELRADWAGTFTIDWTTRTFRITAISEEMIPHSQDTDTAFPLDAWPVLSRLRYERIISFTAADVPTPALVLGRRIENFLAAGLYRDEEMIGFLSIGYFAGNEEAANAAFEQLAAIGESATMALRNTQLFAEARAASRLKSDFVSTMSHELRTPLNVIIGYAEMLREGAAGALTPAQRDLFDKIDVQAHDLYDLIEATLQVGRMETGRDETRLSDIALPDLIASLQGATAQLPRNPDVAFAMHTAEELSGHLHSDLGKVRLIFRNLVSNAFKFTNSGRVDARVEADGDHLLIQVADTGIGIPPESRQTMFEMFRQLDSGSTRAHGGVGLGLYIVQQMVGRLHGHIEVESEVGRGATFTVRLPGYTPALPLAKRGAA